MATQVKDQTIATPATKPVPAPCPPCLCGCGSLVGRPTSRYIPGHDAKHHAQELRARRVAELVAEGHTEPLAVEALAATGGDLDRARRRLNGEVTASSFAKRSDVAQRVEQLVGRLPADAVPADLAGELATLTSFGQAEFVRQLIERFGSR